MALEDIQLEELLAKLKEAFEPHIEIMVENAVTQALAKKKPRPSGPRRIGGTGGSRRKVKKKIR